MTSDDIDDALRLIAVGIEAGLMRELESGALPALSLQDTAHRWAPAFAREQAVKILHSLRGEFEMKRYLPRLPDCTCGASRSNIPEFQKFHYSDCSRFGLEKP